MKRIVLIAGFESFNAGLYRQAAELATARCSELEIQVFSDRDVTAQPDAVASALHKADVFFGSLLFDYDQVLWLRERAEQIPVRLVFESALELMSLTKLGKFAIGDKPKGMPKPVQFILSKFGGNQREEDKLAGYLSFLKVGPKLLKFIPVGKVQDLRNWLIIYGYWNAGGADNVASMLWFLAENYLELSVGEIPPVIETPNIGLLHPDYDGYFESPREYLNWYINHRTARLDRGGLDRGGLDRGGLDRGGLDRGGFSQNVSEQSPPTLSKPAPTTKPRKGGFSQNESDKGGFSPNVSDQSKPRKGGFSPNVSDQLPTTLSKPAPTTQSKPGTGGFSQNVSDQSKPRKGGFSPNVSDQLPTTLSKPAPTPTKPGTGGFSQNVSDQSPPTLSKPAPSTPTKPAPTVGILLYRKHVITKQPYIPQLIRYFEQAGLIPVPIFINGVEGHVAVRDLMTTSYEQDQRQHGHIETPSLSPEAVKVDAIASTIGFPLVGGPAGSMEAGRQVEVAKRILSAKNVPYFVSAPLLIQDIHSWTRQGVGGLQSVVLFALPELDGAIDPVPLGGLVGDRIYLVPERVKRLTGRIKHWIALHQISPAERKIAIILYGFPPGYGATGTAALLNVPKSLLKFLRALKQEGYQVADLPEDGEALIEQVKVADEAYVSQMPHAESLADAPITTVTVRQLEKWLGYLFSSRIAKQWKSLSDSGIRTVGAERPEDSRYLLGGVQLGNVWIGVQPPLGLQGDPMRLMFERDLTPHPQYAAFYHWLQHDFQADAIVHFGMHGTMEWLPGSPLGNTGYSWSDILLGDIPHLYVYAANNPSESILAKRRGYGVLISHNVPPYGRAGLYKELMALRDLIAEYREDPEKNYALKEAICQKIVDSGLDADCPFEDAKRLGIEFTPENARMFSQDAFNRYLVKLYEYLQVLENRLFSSGLHVLGEPPTSEQLEGYLKAYLGDAFSEELLEEISRPVETVRVPPPQLDTSTQPDALQTARQIRDLLHQNTDEITNLLRGLNGEYIPPAPGGDLLRDGPGVLPTGRNIHALDPYRMPSPAAYERGRAIAQTIITQHLNEHGSYPETVAVMLWGLDAIKTKGESIGILLELVGAAPLKEGTGRIVRYELKPLASLDHPRIDILGNLSGIFRDSFVNIIELLDDLFRRAAEADEPVEQNFIRKHALELQSQGIENGSARLFSNPSGDFGSLVNDRVVDANWESGNELGDTWQGRNTFSYGRHDKGQARPEVLESLLKSTNRIVQQIDSVEYGLTDIQEYYANTGGLKKAAEMTQGKKVTANFVESFSKDATPRKLEDLLRMEYRTKLLNPKWADAMAAQGSGGAYEISQRMTALMGWAGTTDFKENWVYDQAADTYALDPVMAEKLRKANPEAFRNIVGRMLEAHGRDFWHPSEETLQKLRDLYEITDEELEGITS